MKPNTKKLLEEYSNRNKDIVYYIKNNDWTTLNDPSFSFETEKELMKNLIKNIKFFITEVEDDVVLKPVRKFLDNTNEILTDHLSRINIYFTKNSHLQTYQEEIKNLQNSLMEYGDFDNLEPDEKNAATEIRKLLFSKLKKRTNLIKFEDELFTHKISVVSSLTKVDISSDNNSSTRLFYDDKKAPLIMREALCEKMPIIKGKTDLLDIDFSASIINPASSKEMLRNMNPKDIPVYDSSKHFFDQDKSTIQFWEEEIRKIKNGVTINGYYIDPFLYWHLNIFKLTLGFNQEKSVRNIDFRDTEYYFNEMLKKTENEKKAGMLAFGSRRIGKSLTASSYTLFRNYTIPNCKSFIGGFSENPDLLAILDYVQDATNNMYPALKAELLTNSIDKGIQMGIRIDPQNSINMATTRIINMEGGSKRGKLKGAAMTPDAGLVDEALHEDEHVITPEGFIKISDISIGDRIFDASGNLTSILNKIDVGVKQLYSIKLRNGVNIKACGDHLWEVKNKINAGKIQVKTTLELLEDLKYQGNRSRYSIRKTEPVNFPLKKIEIDPYYLGLWLGDGKKDRPSITSIDDYIIKYIIKYGESIGLKGNKILKTDGNRKIPTYDVSILNKSGKKNPLLEKLKRYGIYNNKRVPKEYLFNSVEVRLELLSGILDTDGSINKNGSCEIVQVKKDLFEDIRILIESLGISAKCSEKIVKNKVYYRITFNPSLNVFKLPRKLEKQKKSLSKKGSHNREWISIIDIKNVEKKQAYCLKVDNKDKLFLTTMFTVTHNCGKGDILDFWRAYLPAVATGNDKQPYRCVTVLLGTPGDEALSKQAEEMLQHPEDHKLVIMDWDMYDKHVPEEHRTWDNKTKFSFFVPSQMSLEAGEKRKTTLADFLGMDNEELRKIEFYETKWEEKSEMFRQRRKQFSRDAAMLYQEQKNFPINVDECFTHTSYNRFPGKAAIKKRNEILERGEEGRKVRLRKDPSTFKIEADTTNDPLVMIYPWVGGNVSAPICILEEPKENSPFALYVIAVDDVKHKTSDGSSLFSATVYKRGYLGGEWGERIVAHYATRDEDMEYMYLQTYYLIKYYNALCLVENEDESFLNFYERNFPNDLKHLSDGVDFSFRMNLIHRRNRRFGFAADARNISLIENTLEIYTKQKNVIINGEDGFSGLDRVYDIGLLQELGSYRKGQNADRIRTASMAITFGRFLDEWKLHRYLPETEADQKRKKLLREEDVNIFGNDDLSGIDIWS